MNADGMTLADILQEWDADAQHTDMLTEYDQFLGWAWCRLQASQQMPVRVRYPYQYPPGNGRI